MTTDDPSPIRILMANLSESLTRLVVEMVAQNLHMKIVGQVQGQLEVLIGAQIGVDMIILGAPKLKPAPGIVSHILNEYPNTKILVLSTSEDKGTGYWLGIHRCHIEYSTADSLRTGIQELSKMLPSM